MHLPLYLLPSSFVVIHKEQQIATQKQEEELRRAGWCNKQRRPHTENSRFREFLPNIIAI